jgi:hypothetical protein
LSAAKNLKRAAARLAWRPIVYIVNYTSPQVTLCISKIGAGPRERYEHR